MWAAPTNLTAGVRSGTWRRPEQLDAVPRCRLLQPGMVWCRWLREESTGCHWLARCPIKALMPRGGADRQPASRLRLNAE
jgi:hypothetical protein